MPTASYAGTELMLFASASRWKSYLASRVRPYLGQRVLEVGAGIGGTTPFLYSGQQAWVCLEPDPALLEVLAQKIAAGQLPAACAARLGTLADLAPQECFDALLYVDVLEHIADDRQELHRAAAHLSPGGHLIVVAPAHQFLYTPFDRAIGHFRRYDRRSLLQAAPGDLRRVRMCYLDSAGVLASLANRLLLRQSEPSRRQIDIWDRVLVRCSRWLDPVLGYRLGKSILAVWQRMV
jgi:SAM-dependent methyltransferase